MIVPHAMNKCPEERTFRVLGEWSVQDSVWGGSPRNTIGDFLDRSGSTSIENVLGFLCIGVKFRLVTNSAAVALAVVSGGSASIWLGCCPNTSGFKAAETSLVFQWDTSLCTPGV